MKRICIGKITAAHGIKGLVKILPFGEDVNLLNGRLYISDEGADTLSVTLKNPVGKFFLAAIDGVNDKTKADTLGGTMLWVERAILPEPEDGEFYIDDLAGLAAHDKDGHVIGTVISLQNFGAGDLLEIKPNHEESFFLIFTKENVPSVDIENGIITINLPPEIDAE